MKFIIQGRKILSGEVYIPGAKNEATKLVAASCMTDQDVVIDNAPYIQDLEKMMEIVRSMGGRADWTGDHQLTLNCADIDIAKIDHHLVKKLRASIVFIGPLLTRFAEFDFPTPGGCIIGNRSLDTHLEALKKLGVKIDIDETGNNFHFSREKMVGREIVLQEFSVTATENILMAASLAQGKTILKIAAAEPHVEDLVLALNKMGAKIKWIANHTLEIEGVDKLSGLEHRVIPDTIDVGTFAILAAVTKSNLMIKNVRPDHMDLFLEKFREFGVNFKEGGDYLHIKPSGSLKAVNKIETNIYPGIPTDLQQPLTLLATQANGTTLVFEKMFEGRFGFVSALKEMGANIEILDPHRILVTGPTPLQGAEVKSFDLRAGATLIIAGLLADGETIIHEAELIERGYEDIIGRLKSIGASIKKIEE